MLMMLLLGLAESSLLSVRPLKFHHLQQKSTIMPLPALAIEETIEEEPIAKGVVIPLPAGFKAPHNKRDGEEFEILVKASQEGDQLRLHSADGFSFSDEALEEPEQAVETEEEGGMEEDSADEASDEEAAELNGGPNETEDDEGQGLMAAIQKARSGKMPYRK